MTDSLDLALGAIPERPTILVVEDEPHIREVLSGLLGALGYRLLMAVSAEQALDVLNVVSPDLVLTDVQLGAMSGIELCARLKADPRYELMPVVILTAVGDLEARVAGLAAGADDFFTKPVEFVELRTRLAALLRVKMLLGQLERVAEALGGDAHLVRAARFVAGNDRHNVISVTNQSGCAHSRRGRRDAADAGTDRES